METFISRFKRSLKSADSKSIRQILTEIVEISHEPYEIWLEVINTLALIPDDKAWDPLFFLSEINFTTSDIREKLLQLILDRAHLNFNFLPILYKAGDEKKIQKSVSLMKHVLDNETDTGIIMETIQAVGKYKLDALSEKVNEYIYFDNAELKAHAVQSLQSIGSHGAIALLEHAATTVKCDQNILNALSYLRENPVRMVQKRTDTPEEETSLFRALESVSLDTRFNALTRLAALRIRNKDRLALNLLSNNHDLVINTLDIIKHTFPEELLPSLYRLLEDTTIAPTIRFAAYDALEGFPDPDLSSCPLTGITDHRLYIQMAAIKLLDKKPTSEALYAIKHTIEAGGKKGKQLVQAILYAKAARITDSLMESDTFSYFASNYLEEQAGLSCIEQYIKILKNRGLKTTAKKFTRILKKKAEEKHPTALIIGRSKTMMAFHASLAHQRGYTPLDFLSSQDAFSSAAEAEPELIVSELFLDGITVVEFALKLCEFYPSKEIPLVISTLQQAFTGNRLRPVWHRIGIHEIHEFPPDAAHITPAG